MRIAIIVPPFITVPPARYGGTELFAANLAVGLDRLGFEVVVYTIGESSVPVERRWLYPHSQWPINTDTQSSIRDVDHCAWAIADAAQSCDIIHISNPPSIVHSRFVKAPFVYTLHHAHDDFLSEFYRSYPDIWYVTISYFQGRFETMSRIRTIHHGLDLSCYPLGDGRRTYLTFLGRIAPIKGPHIAIEVARRAGIPLKIAGEVQPMFRDYFESQVKPRIDGKLIEYVGEADHAMKVELLGSSLGLLFPIQWDEPFGLVMIEAMACGTPVFALPGGSVAEVVKDGVSGTICLLLEDMVRSVAKADEFDPRIVRQYMIDNFSLERMVQAYADLYLEAANISAGELSSHGDEGRMIA